MQSTQFDVVCPPSSSEPPELKASAIARPSGYAVLASGDFEIGRVTLLQHSASGAKVLAIQGTNPVNSFAAVIPTQAESDSGREHATEHLALFRSRKSQATVDNFSAMSYGSYNTDLNAATLKDYTIFPLSSLALKEMQRMMQIYIQGLLEPAFCKEDFELEVCHLRMKRKGGASVSAFGGVVYNEVRDYYSDPQWHAIHLLEANLFPTSHYRFDHGGVPLEVTRLSHDELEAFCRANYRPDRMLFILQQQQADLAETLAALDNLLSAAQPSDPLPPRIPPPAFTAPRTVETHYPFFGAADTEAPHFVELGWALAPAESPQRRALLELLSEYLIGSEAAPLIRELSVRFPQAVVGGNFDLDCHRPVLAVSLEGITAEQAPVVEQLVLDQLRELIEAGPSPLLVRSVKSQLAIDTFNRLYDPAETEDLFLGLAAAHSNGLDLTSNLRESEFLKELSVDSLRAAIKQELLDNPHRLLLSVIPDRDLGAKALDSEAARLQEMVAQVGGVEAVKAETEKRRSWAKKLTATSSAEWDFNERAADITAPSIRAAIEPDAAHPAVSYSPIQISEVCSFNILYDAVMLPTDLLRYAGLVSDAVFSRFHPGLRREDAHLRFTAAVPLALLDFDFGKTDAGLNGFGLVSLRCRTVEAAEALKEIAACLREPLELGPKVLAAVVAQRLRTLQAKYVSDLDQMLVTAAQAALAPQQQLVDLIEGIAQINFLMELRQDLKNDDKLEPHARNIAKLQETLFSRPALGQAICHPEHRPSLTAQLTDTFQFARRQELKPRQWELPALPGVQRIDRPALGAAAAQAFDLASFSLEDRAAAHTLCTLYLHNYLLPFLRTSRSAYRVRLVPDNEYKLPTFLVAKASREAALEALQQFPKVSDYVSRANLTSEELERGKIGILGRLDAEGIADPISNATESFTDKAAGSAPEERQRFRAAVVAQTVASLTKISERLTETPPRSASVLCLPEED